jgi:hypothetical protein
MNRFEAVTGYYEVPGGGKTEGALYDAETDEFWWEPSVSEPPKRVPHYWKGREGSQLDAVKWRLQPGYSMLPIRWQGECAECGELLMEVDYLCNDCRGLS